MLLSLMIPPLSTTSTRTVTTSSGIVLSEELTTAEISRPAVIDAIASRATPSISSTRGASVSTTPCGGSGRPARPIATSTAAWTALMTPRTMSFEAR